MARREAAEPSQGRVIVFRDVDAKAAEEIQPGARDFVEILEVEEVAADYIRAGSYVFPTSDTVRMTSELGLVYAVNASLPYLAETAHLADVEKNIVFGSAFKYPGRSSANARSNIPMIVMMVGAFLIATFAIFAK